jgi:hypothetical protein
MGAGHLHHERASDLVLGFAPSMKAKLAFTAVSEIPLFGSREAAISCCSEVDESTRGSAESILQSLPPLAGLPIRGIGSGIITLDPP